MKYLIVIILLIVSVSTAFAQQTAAPAALADTALAHLGNRIIDSVEKFAAWMGVTTEKAFPYAVAYVKARYESKALTWSFAFILCYIINIPMLYRFGRVADWDNGDKYMVFSVINIIFIIIGFIAMLVALGTYRSLYIFYNAPEASTIKYLLDLNLI